MTDASLAADIIDADTDPDAMSWQLPAQVSGVSVAKQVRLAIYRALVLLIFVEGVLMSLREAQTSKP